MSAELVKLAQEVRRLGVKLEEIGYPAGATALNDLSGEMVERSLLLESEGKIPPSAEKILNIPIDVVKGMFGDNNPAQVKKLLEEPWVRKLTKVPDLEHVISLGRRFREEVISRLDEDMSLDELGGRWGSHPMNPVFSRFRESLDNVDSVFMLRTINAFRREFGGSVTLEDLRNKTVSQMIDAKNVGIVMVIVAAYGFGKYEQEAV